MPPKLQALPKPRAPKAPRNRNDDREIDTQARQMRESAARFIERPFRIVAGEIDSLMLPYPPSGNRYWRHFGNRTVRSSVADAYIAVVREICTRNGFEPVSGPVHLAIRFHRPAKRGDIDNFCKVLLDSLRGNLYHDDAQIEELHAVRYEDKTDPRVVVGMRWHSKAPPRMEIELRRALAV